MIFVSFEDENAVYETVLFPDAFKRFYPLLDDGWAFLVFGKVEEDQGALAISVERLVNVSRRVKPAAAERTPATESAPAARRNESAQARRNESAQARRNESAPAARCR
jgi:DNA polymerase III alpha subunit